MNMPCVYEIRVAGSLAGEWSAWFEGLEVCPARHPDEDACTEPLPCFGKCNEGRVNLVVRF